MREPPTGIDRLALCAVCGLLCRTCSVYLASTEDPAWLERLAARNGVSVEEERCSGCRGPDRSYHCESCQFSRCARKRGVTFCGECSEYPCQELRVWRERMPHRVEVFEALRRIAKVGWDAWYAEALEDFRCPECGTLNAAYNLACRQCGIQPSCAFVGRHGAAIQRFQLRQAS
jgi:predicted RNA-binding Zn-ribbon protein involved in translation (DUF1610 family)